MQLQKDNLGKVSVTIEKDYWDVNKDYDKLTVVEKEGIFGTYISRKPVPAGTALTDRTYWIPFSSLKEEIVLGYNKWVNDYGGLLNSQANVLNSIQEQINDIYTHLPQGVIFTGNISYIRKGYNDNIILTARTVNEENANFVLYKNNVEVYRVENDVDNFSYFDVVDGDTEYKLITYQNDYKYVSTWNVGVALPLYAGAGQTYNNAIGDDNIVKISTNISGIYSILVENEGDYIFFVAPKDQVIKSIKMNGLDVPIKSTKTVYLGTDYTIYQSDYTYKPGLYPIQINEYTGLNSEDFLGILNSLGDTASAVDVNSLKERIDNLPINELIDKNCDESTFSGMGRVYFRKNIKNNKNVLEQKDLIKSNTIYVVQYDFDLENKEIKIPDNCVLCFLGGSINNGGIAFNNCFIQATKDISILNNIVISSTNGYIKNNNINVLWFQQQNNKDISKALQNAADIVKQKRHLVPSPKYGTVSFSTIDIPYGSYTINTSVSFYYGAIINFNNSFISSSLTDDFILKLLQGSYIVNDINVFACDKCLFINTANLDFTKIKIFNCNFNFCNICIDTNDFNTSRSTILTIDSCYFIKSNKCVLSWVDKLNIEHCWIYAPDNINSALITTRGLATITNSIFVPVKGGDNARYIDLVSKNKTEENYVECFGISIKDCRFGGEEGNFPILYNNVDYTKSNLLYDSFINIENCYVCATNSKSAIIVLNALPNLINIKNIVGIKDLQKIVVVSDDFNINNYSKSKKRIIIEDFVHNGYYKNYKDFVSEALVPITEIYERNNTALYKQGTAITFKIESSYHKLAQAIDTNLAACSILISYRTYSNIDLDTYMFNIVQVTSNQIHATCEQLNHTKLYSVVNKVIAYTFENNKLSIYVKSPTSKFNQVSILVMSSENIEFYNNLTEVLSDTSSLHYCTELISFGEKTIRPTNVKKGFQYFDTTIGKPIYWNGTNWVDSTGTSV